jgi:1,2-diacylglycerol 3-alpha-glucosyltransferase
VGPLKIFFSCSGVGIIDRGIETFFREAFEGLRGTDGLDITLYKGAGEERSDERVLWNLPRTGRLAESLGKVIRRNGYVVEQLSTFPSMVRAIRKHRPDIIFYSDSNLGFQLFRWRKQIGVPFRLLFSNGGPCHPPFIRTDYVHQVAPVFLEEALAAGEPAQRQCMVPYGISVPAEGPNVSEPAKRAVRERLGLPLARQIVLSVGWISAQQKRMDYLVEEVVRLSSPRPYLVLLGAMDDQSETILKLAREKLGAENFSARSVRYEQTADYYRAADVFVLASLQEGFGRVFLEALIYGLPVFAHEHPVMRFVLNHEGVLCDLSQPGSLSARLQEGLREHTTAEVAARRRESVRERFSWEMLAPRYREMFFDCARIVHPFGRN